MTFHGHGFLSLELPDVAPLTSSVYSGFGFRSAQDSGLLYHRASPVRPAQPWSDRLPAPQVCLPSPPSDLCPALPQSGLQQQCGGLCGWREEVWAPGLVR